MSLECDYSGKPGYQFQSSDWCGASRLRPPPGQFPDIGNVLC